MKIKIYKNKFLILTFGFILFTIIGTLSHEYGHILAAKILGHQTTLHYGSMEWSGKIKKEHYRISEKYWTEILAKKPFPEKEKFRLTSNKMKKDNLHIALGGPIQTILTGTFGLLFLLYRFRKIKTSGLKIVDWLGVFFALFWLREVFNLTMSIASEILHPDGSYFGGDEKNISNMLDLPSGMLSIILAIIGLAVVLFVLFKILDKKLQLTFLLSGLVGGVLGFVFWMNFLGPIVLP